MKRPSTHVFILVVSCVLALMLVAAAVHYPRDDVGGPTDAAFRDGLFLGRQDAEHGRKPHLSTGRWSADADRRLFVSAYLQAYGEMFGASGDEPRTWHGYTERMGDVTRYKQLYREAYSTGYQQGYYGEPEKIESAKFAQLSEPE